MKKGFYLGFIAFAVFSLLVSCDGNKEIVVNPGGDESVSYDGRDSDEWTNDEDPEGGTIHGGGDVYDENGYKCPVCGKYLDDTVDGDHCSDLDGRTKYTYAAYDSANVLYAPGSMGAIGVFPEDGNKKIGNFSQNVGCKFEYIINSDIDTTACLQLVATNRSSEIYVNKTIAVRINGKKLDNWARLAKTPSSSDWTDFVTATLGCISLQKGDNYISFGMEEDNVAFDCREINLLTKATLTQKPDIYVDPRDGECTHKDGDGKCTDYDSNLFNCLDKDETGWSSLIINGGVDEVIKTDGAIWNTTEFVIGNINAATGQRIAFAFNLSEDSYIRISIEHSWTGSRNYWVDDWNLTFNNKSFETGGKLCESSKSSWFDFGWGKVGYLKGKAGFNQFSMEHIVNPGYNLKNFEVTAQKGSITLAQAIL